jgi:glycosyltransferase involved in cell wall biosynthesis
VLIGVDASRINRPLLTGTETYSLELLRALLLLDQSNAYRLYLARTLAAGTLPAGRPIETRLIRRNRLWTHVGLSAEMRRAPPELLFVPSHVIPLVHPSRTVVVVYDVGHRYVPEAHALSERAYLELAVRWHVRVGTQLLTISEAARQDLVRLYGADPDRVAVAYPAVDPSFRPPQADAIRDVRKRYRLGAPYVLHVGTLKPRKNLPRLIAAFARAALPNSTRLILVGADQGGARASALLAADRVGVTDRLDLLSYVDRADLPALYGAAAAVAVVSLHEGFGMPALEALACGAPLVASDRGALAEVVADAGLLVDPLSTDDIAGALARIVGDVACAGRLRLAGPRRADGFTWQRAAAVTLAVLERAGRTSTPSTAARNARPLAPS